MAIVNKKSSEAKLSPADIEWIEERAGILEFDAGLSREEAEKEALKLFKEYQLTFQSSSDGMNM